MRMKPTESELLCKLERAAKNDPDFSASDMAEIHELIQAWKGWKSLGKASKWLITSLGLVAALLGALAAIWASLKGFAVK